jgi:hypothetical protein
MKRKEMLLVYEVIHDVTDITYAQYNISGDGVNYRGQKWYRQRTSSKHSHLIKLNTQGVMT